MCRRLLIGGVVFAGKGSKRCCFQTAVLGSGSDARMLADVSRVENITCAVANSSPNTLVYSYLGFVASAPLLNNS